jgi:tetratricopeptide (TPR) repeat protein
MFRHTAALLLSGLLASVPLQAADTPAAFSHQGLHRLMLAEFALSRDKTAEALPPYREEALASSDPAVIIRALQVANYLQNSAVGLELANRLTELSPRDPAAWFQAAYHALRLQDADQAMNAIGKLLELNPEAELEPLFLNAFPSTPEGRNRLMQAINTLDARYPQNNHLQFAYALLAGENGQYSTAIEHIERALSGNPGNIPAILLHARLLSMNNQTDEALRVLSDAVMKHPNSRQINLHYARALIKAGHPFQAESRLRQMLRNLPNDGEVLLLHGLLAFNNRHDDVASQSLQALLMNGENTDEAHYYLALIARRKQDNAQAENHLKAISEGPHFVAAANELADLLADTQRLDEARISLATARRDFPDQAVTLYAIEADLLNKRKFHQEAMQLLVGAIEQHPKENILRFARALTADRLKNLPLFEKDMQELLARDPDNASYLNALGYTLADQTRRLGEAEVYLRHAYRLKPEDPAIIDSMGWLYFRLGNVNEALEYVRKAYTLLQDEEIGLHLAEILWTAGKHAEAGLIWQQLLQKNPGSEAVLKHKALFEPKP